MTDFREAAIRKVAEELDYWWAQARVTNALKEIELGTAMPVDYVCRAAVDREEKLLAIEEALRDREANLKEGFHPKFVGDLFAQAVKRILRGEK